MKKIKLIALFGPAGAGKDFLLALWESKFQFHKVINHSTRPMREQESYGNPYYFTTVKNYMDMLKNNEFIQRSEFNNWFYGTALSELKEDVINIGVFNIAAIEQLLADGRIEVIPILVTAPDKTRLVRQLNREYEPDCTEICRRFLSDKEDYSDISFVYATYPNGGGSSLNTHCDRLEIILQEWPKLENHFTKIII